MSDTVRVVIRIVFLTVLAIVSVAVALFACTTYKCVRDMDANMLHIRQRATVVERAKAEVLAQRFADAQHARYWFQQVLQKGQAALAVNHIARACDARYSIAE